MKFEWDNVKEERNRKKHRIDFRTATKVFLDPFVVDFEDRDPSGETRFNAIGFVEGRVLVVTMRSEATSPVLFRREAPSPMKKGSTTKFRLNPRRPPKTDWRAFDAMTEEERHAAAVSDPDCPPATEEQLARARRVVNVRAIRQRLNLTQEEFAERFGLPLGTVRDWEQGAHRPDRAAQVLLRVIAANPDAVIRALKQRSAA